MKQLCFLLETIVIFKSGDILKLNYRYRIVPKRRLMKMMDRRQKNVEIFEDTRLWYTQDAALKEAVKHSRQNTQFYQPGSVSLPKEALARFSDEATIVVSRDRTFQATEKYAGQKVTVLNFASATNPGGGVTRGSSAQEEALCRCSTLYPCLLGDKLWQSYYQMHRNRHNATHTDACIYVPDVWIIKTDTDSPVRLPRDKMRTVDVICCAAPNLRERPGNSMNPDASPAIRLSKDELYALHRERARKIMSVAALHGTEVLVLGAFGCGAFCNPPAIVAAAYRDVLPEFSHAFRTVEFAVYCPPRDDTNYQAFRSVLKR